MVVVKCGGSCFEGLGEAVEGAEAGGALAVGLVVGGVERHDHVAVLELEVVLAQVLVSLRSRLVQRRVRRRVTHPHHIPPPATKEKSIKPKLEKDENV